MSENFIAHIASPQRCRPEKCCVYLSHTRLYVDFSWDSVARKNSVTFGVNVPLLLLQLAISVRPLLVSGIVQYKSYKCGN